MGEKNQPHIILVEDNLSISKLIEYRLRKENLSFTAYENGVEGWHGIQEHRPAVVILDVMLPGMSGFEILRRIREDEQLKDTPVVMLTTKGREEDMKRGFDLQVQEYMTKPFKMEEFYMRLKRLLPS